jgi:hypothetical protein
MSHNVYYVLFTTVIFKMLRYITPHGLRCAASQTSWPPYL